MLLAILGARLLCALHADALLRIRIEATTVDAEVEPADDLVLEIDDEGAELDVLAGAHRTLAGSKRTVRHVELNPTRSRRQVRSPSELVQTLRDLGFELWRIDQTARALFPLTGDDTGCWKGKLLGRS